MKVALAGNYGHGNLGDEALLEGAISCVATAVGVSPGELIVLSDDQSDSILRLTKFGCEVRQLKRPLNGRLYRIPFVVADIYRALRGVDWLVFGGGGLLNDSNTTAVPLFTIVNIIARLRGVRIAWMSIGIGPLEGKIHRWLVRRLLRSCDFLTVRDEKSADLASAITGKPALMAPDLAHGLTGPLIETSEDRIRVAVSVIPYKKPGVWFESSEPEYRAYCDKIVQIVKALLQSRQDIHVTLTPVSLIQDQAAIEDISEIGSLGNHARVSAGQPKSVDDLINELARTTVVVASRLHSAVLGVVAGRVPIGIPYQPKVSSYLIELGADSPCFDIDAFSAEDVVQSVLSRLDGSNSRDEIVQSINKKRREMIADSLQPWREML